MVSNTINTAIMSLVSNLFSRVMLYNQIFLDLTKKITPSSPIILNWS